MKLISIENKLEDYLYITYNFTSTCNFNCTYCWPAAHDGKFRFPNLEIVCNNFSHLLRSYNKGNVRITISGGEPTLWPELGKFAKYLKENHNCRLTLNTNGSRTLRWWKEYCSYFDDIQISVHNKFAEIPHTIEVLDEIYSRQNIMVAAQMLMDPNNWDKSVDNVNQLVSHSTPWLVKLMTLVDPLTGQIMNYTDNQLEFLKNKNQKTPPQDYIARMFETGKIVEESDVNAVMTFDNSLVQPFDTFEILKNKWNQFKGWSCSIGNERLGIDASGNLAGNCGEVVSDEKFNLHNKSFLKNFTLEKINSTSTCSKQFCDCTSDIKVTKYV